jgi:hypothetical protein
MWKSAIVLLLVLCFVTAGLAQLDLPRPSPKSSVMQYVGITKVKITYSSPGVKGRTIWGGLVPYDKVWRTGANEATEIHFSTDVKINGQDLPAGEYSFFTIPGESEWTVMFNSRTDIGGMDYQEEADVLKLQVKPQSGEFRERMTFLIENNTNSSADIVLHWEKLRLVLKMEVNTDEMIMANAEKEIGDTWETPYRAANYFLSQDTNLEKAMEWINLSTSLKETYWNTRVKARLQAKQGKKKDAVKTLTQAIALGEKMENAPFDFDAMKKMLEEWKK